MKISFTGSKPDSYAYSYSVKGNSGTDRLEFELDVMQDGYDLSQLTPQIKIKSNDGNYKDILTSLDNSIASDGKIIVICVLENPMTSYEELIIQLEFIGASNADTWQTEVLHLYIKETMNLNEEDNPSFTEAMKSKAEVIYKRSDSEFPDIGTEKNIYMTNEGIYRYDSNSKKYICLGKNYTNITEIQVTKGA